MNINPSIQLATSMFYIALFALDSDVRINVSYSFFTVYSVSYSCFRVGNTIATVKKSPWSITKKSDSFGIYLNQLCKYVFLFGLQWHHSICSWRHRKNNENGEKACPTLLCPIATACGIFTGAVATQCRDLKNNLCKYSTSAFSSANFLAISLWLCVQKSAICRTPTRCQTKPWTRETGYVSLECRLPVRVWKLQLIWTAHTHTHTPFIYRYNIYIYRRGSDSLCCAWIARA